MSVGGSLVGPTLMAKWFVRKRGRAMAIGTMGVSTGGLLIAPLAGWLIITYDWRIAWAVLGVIIILAVVPASFFFIRRSPEDVGLLPDGDTPEEGGTPKQTAKAAVSEYPWTVRQALRTRAAWLLMAMQALGSMGLLAVLVHQVAYIQEKGFDPGTAATVATTVAFFSAVGKVPWGLATERLHVRWVTAICFVLAGLSLMLLVLGSGLAVMYVYAVCYGITFSGMASLTQIVWADYFGRQHAGAIRGAVAPASSALSASSPLLVGWLWDIQGDYVFAFTLLAGFWIGGGLLALLAPPPKPPSMQPADAAKAAA
jgi:MFS family permease